MKLDDIGFYTLSDKRAQTASASSRLMRAELILGARCNFSCAYCRGIGGPDVPLKDACDIIERLAEDELFALRLSGGEPTIHPHLLSIVRFAKTMGIEKIAISTNGSADKDFYKKLIDAGVNDMSISLDSCCASDFGKMAGVEEDALWSKLVYNIAFISSQIYTTVGVVLNEDNRDKANEIIIFADSLGVSDIRVIPAAQDSSVLSEIQVDKQLLAKYPILRYRYDNIMKGKSVRGLSECAPSKCPLVLDDVAIMGGQHYPCIIYMREGGFSIGEVGPDMRAERKEWFEKTNTHKEEICKKSCLDACSFYNQKWLEFHKGEYIL